MLSLWMGHVLACCTAGSCREDCILHTCVAALNWLISVWVIVVGSCRGKHPSGQADKVMLDNL
jgi:hypothetical protein